VTSTAPALPAKVAAPPPGRAVELDGMRTIAIIAMAASHVSRTIRHSIRPDWCAPALLLDPFIQALFMALVGASLAWSWHNAMARGTDRGTWLRGRLRRAGQVYLFGVLLFLFDKGLQLPWIVIAPGILADIALAIVAYGVIASSRRPVLGALLLSAAGYGLLAVLDARGLTVPPLNAANAPLVPNFAITGLGLAAGIGLLRDDRRLLSALGLLGLAGAAWLLRDHSVAELLDSPFGRTENDMTYLGRSHGLANTWGLLTGAELRPHTVTYFNPALRAQPFVLGAVVATWLLLRLLRPLIERVQGWLFVIGRHSLGVYVFHLALVGLPVAVLGRSKPLRTTLAANSWMLFVLLACYAFAGVRHWQLARRRAQRAGG